MRSFLLLLPIVLAACSGGGGDTCAPTVGNAEVDATLGSDGWKGVDATWRVSGTSLQINVSSVDGSSLSFVLQNTTDGATGDVAAPPAEVDLGEAGGGWIVYYPDTGDSLSTGVAGGSGTFTLASRGDTLGGCFSGVLSDGNGFTEVLEGELLAVEANPGTP